MLFFDYIYIIIYCKEQLGIFMMEEKILKSQKSIDFSDGCENNKRKTILKQPQHDRFNFQSSDVKDFKAYIEIFDHTLNQVNINQLDQLKKKYRFYLSKVQKLEQTKTNLQQKYDSMEDFIQNSAPIKQEKESIRFISMISIETTKKLENVTQKVNLAKDEKKNYEKQILLLKQKIKKQKDKFFQLKRQQTRLKTDMQACQKASKLQSANCTFKNIVQDKLIKKKQKIESMKQNSESQRVNQISTRLSCFQALKVHQQQQLNQIKQEQDKNKLPQIHQLQINDSQNVSHKRRESCMSQANQQISTKKILNQDLSLSHQLMSRSAAFQQYKSNFTSKNKITHQGYPKSKKISKNKLVVLQLNKISQMKEQLIKQTSKIQNAEILNIKKKYDQFINGCTEFQKRNQFLKNQNKSLANISSSVQKNNHKNSTLNIFKNCNACQYNSHQYRISIQKFSLHQQQADQIRARMGQKNQQNLLANASEANKAKQLQQQRQAFLNQTPQQIVSKIVQKQKIGEVLKLMQRQNIFSINNTSGLKLLR